MSPATAVIAWLAITANVLLVFAGLLWLNNKLENRRWRFKDGK